MIKRRPDAERMEKEELRSGLLCLRVGQDGFAGGVQRVADLREIVVTVSSWRRGDNMRDENEGERSFFKICASLGR